MMMCFECLYSVKVNQCIITDFSATFIIVISVYIYYFSIIVRTDSFLEVMVFLQIESIENHNFKSELVYSY